MIDAHVHCWDREVFAFDWLDTYPTLPRRRVLADYPTAGRVTSAILVEAGAAVTSTAEAAWLASQQGPVGIVGIVANLAVERGGRIGDELDAMLDRVPTVCGIRRNLEALPVGASRDASFRDGVAAVGARGLTFDLCASGATLDDAVDLAASLPAMRFVLDHVGKPALAGDDGAWVSALDAAAALPNVWCKLSGLLVRGDGSRPSDESAVAALRHAVALYGPDRCILASDWPVISVNAEPADWWALCDAALDGFAADEVEMVEHGAAMAAYSLHERHG